VHCIHESEHERRPARFTQCVGTATRAGKVGCGIPVRERGGGRISAVNRRLVIVLGGLALLACVAGFLLLRPAPEPPKPVSRVEPARTRRVETPAPVTAPAPEPPKRSARLAPAPKAAPGPAAAPAPAEPSPDLATLHIDSDVPGAQVFIDREFIGAAPVTAANVKPGSHRLNVSAPGYDGVADTIEVVPGPRDIVVKLKEIRLDVNIEVVHKHRMGSCRGRLVATPRGLKYETSDKDDGFSAGLLDLETFQVDYLQKNLRVQRRKGRRYDFTDPDGNADRLFVFHREVEKARERLKSGL